MTAPQTAREPRPGHHPACTRDGWHPGPCATLTATRNGWRVRAHQDGPGLLAAGRRPHGPVRATRLG